MAKKKIAKREDSPGYRLIALVWEHQGHGMGRSRERFAAGMREAVCLAIGYGLRFDVDDFERLATADRYEPSCGFGEYKYALACGSDRGRYNRSAVLAMETRLRRKPLKIEDEGTATPTRIYVGRRFIWKGRRVKCTSFDDDKQTLVAVEYRADTDRYEHKVKRRFTIAADDIRAARREKKQRDALWKRFSQAGGEGSGEGKRWEQFCNRFTASSGIQTSQQWQDTPIDKLAEEVERFLETEEGRR